MGGLCGFYQSFIINFVCEKEVLQNGENSRLKKLYRGSPLSTIFGIWKKPYYVKFVLVSTTQSISTSTVYSTQKFHQYGVQYIALKNRTSGNRTTGNRTKGGPTVLMICVLGFMIQTFLLNIKEGFHRDKPNFLKNMKEIYVDLKTSSRHLNTN